MEGIHSVDVNDFSSRNYVNFKWGDQASKFLPKYEDLTDYESIEFHYMDCTMKNSFLHEYGVTFVVNVKYNHDIYLQKKEEVLAQYTYKDILMVKLIIPYIQLVWIIMILLIIRNILGLYV